MAPKFYEGVANTFDVEMNSRKNGAHINISITMYGSNRRDGSKPTSYSCRVQSHQLIQNIKHPIQSTKINSPRNGPSSHVFTALQRARPSSTICPGKWVWSPSRSRDGPVLINLPQIDRGLCGIPCTAGRTVYWTGCTGLFPVHPEPSEPRKGTLLPE